MEALGGPAQPSPDPYRIAGAANKGRWSILMYLMGALLSFGGDVLLVFGAILGGLAALQGMSAPGAIAMAPAGLVVWVVGGLLILASVALFIIALSEFSQEFWRPGLFRDGIILLVIIVINFLVYFAGVPFLLFVFYVIEGYFLKRIFDQLADGSQGISGEAADKFRSAGKWFWIGGWLTIVVIGSIMWLVAYDRAFKGFGALQNAAVAAALGPQRPGPSLGGPG